MHTVTLKIPDEAIYEQLMQLLRSFRQVEVSEATTNITVQHDTAPSLQQLLDRCSASNVFNKIQDPVAWQQTIRDEWQ